MVLGGIPARIGFACLVASALVSRAAITHRYSFNDGTANDSVGAADGVLVNGAAVSGGQLVFDPAVNDGTNSDPTTGQYLRLPSNILHTRAFSLEAWFTLRGGNSWQRIVDLGNSIPNTAPPPQGNIGHGFLILTPLNSQRNVLGQISINSWGNPADTDLVASSAPISLNTEHQIVYTHDPDAHVEQLYVDGALVGQSQARVDPSTADYTNFWIGRSQFSQDPFLDGSVDELRTYDNALTFAQVTQDARLGPNVVPEPGAGILAGAVAVVLIFPRRRSSGVFSP